MLLKPCLSAEVNRAMGAGLIAHIRNGTTDQAASPLLFSASEYNDPEVVDRERELVFGRVPAIVAHTSELPDPHDFVTSTLACNRVIIVRQRDGSVRSFVNACRHRGSLLADAPSGHCRVMTCPYHGWSYQSDGRLRSITHPDTFGPVDRDTHGLVELPTEERHGFIWVVDRPGQTIDVAAWLGPQMDEVLAACQLDQCVCHRMVGIDTAANWKLLVDAFLDSYHIRFAHSRTVAPYFYGNVNFVEPFGRHARLTSPRKTIDTILDDPPDAHRIEDHVTIGHFVMPNVNLLRQPDHFQLLSFFPHPSDPCRSRMELRLLIPGPLSSEEEERLWDKNWQILMDVLRDEDLPLNENCQLAAGSHDASPLMLGRNELVNQLFHRELSRLVAHEGGISNADPN